MSNVAVDSQTQTYNGWSNRETWLASLWLSNDDGSYILRDATGRTMSIYEQAEYLESLMRDQLEDEVGDASLWSDLLNTSFNRINWVEVVENNQ